MILLQSGRWLLAGQAAGRDAGETDSQPFAPGIRGNPSRGGTGL